VNYRLWSFVATWLAAALLSIFLFASMPMSATAWIVAAALIIGLLSRDLAANALEGLWLRRGPGLGIGSYIRLEDARDVEGTVTEVGWHATTLVTQAGDLVSVPNQRLANSAFTNFLLPPAKDGIAVDVDATREAAAPRVSEILQQEARTAVHATPGVVPGTATVQVLPGRLPESRRYILRCRVRNPAARNVVQKELRRRVTHRLQRAGIPILTFSRQPDETS